MEQYVFQDFLSRFDSRGLFSCTCGRVHTLATRNVMAERGALARSADLLLESHGPGVALWVLSDENTEKAAAGAWKAGVRASRIVSHVLPRAPRPEPSAEVIDELSREVRAAAPGLLVSVGSGVISDLVKKVSMDTGVPNWCVATAASVDAFTSATSAIHVDGFHNAVPAAVSETVICDLDVIERAPREMVLAGFGDLLAKFIAHLDWNLSRVMTGEHYCEIISRAGLESARKALAAARRLREEPGEAARSLTDAVLTSGFAMQAMGSSRSAASAEHTMAHFWEIADAVSNQSLDLHGILVGAASRLVLHGYRAFYGSLPGFRLDPGARLRAFASEKPWQDSLEPGLTPYREKVFSEMAEKKMDRGTLAQRLSTFERSRGSILELAVSALDELAAAIDLLDSMSYPFSPAELGLSAEQCLLPARNVRFLRARYSTFDLAYELGLEQTISSEMKRKVSAGEGAARRG